MKRLIFLFFLILAASSIHSQAEPTEEGQDWMKSDPEHIISKLRHEMLTVDALEMGITPEEDNRVWGVLMETIYDDVVVSLVTMAEGSVSLYYSNGKAVIGIGQHQSARHVSLEFISLANAFLYLGSLVEEFPLPVRDECIFYFRTFEGVYKAVADRKELKNNRSPLSPLFFKADDVITEYRLIYRRRENLLQAASDGNISKIKELIDSGAYVDSKDETGITALMTAAFKGERKTVLFLLESKAQTDLKDGMGYTALMFAANSGHIECAKLLIKGGSEVNETDYNGNTPIHFAAQHGNTNLVRLLLESGAIPTMKGQYGLTAIDLARQNGHKKTEEILRLK